MFFQFGVERNSAIYGSDVLFAFIAVVDQLNFRAAILLGITHSALSHSMQQLKRRLGITHRTRMTRSEFLTDAGNRSLERLWPAIELDGKAEEARRSCPAGWYSRP